MIIQTWATNFLESQGFYCQGDWEPVRIMPWSSVYKIQTNQGWIYLKEMAEIFKIDALLIQHLSTHFHQWTPRLIGYNPALRSFLMKDSGSPLRDYLNKHYDLSLAKSVLSQYAMIQQQQSNNLEALLQLGVPDWRLKNFPNLYLEVLQQKKLLLEEGINPKEIKQLYALLSIVQVLCQTLTSYGIPESIEHGDFHDNNILLNNDHFTIHDWGDAVITHPFFSLISFLYSSERNHQLKKDSSIYEDLKNAYLASWVKLYGHEQVLQAFEIANQLADIKFVIGCFRISQCPGMEDLGQFRGMLSESLRSFLKKFG